MPIWKICIRQLYSRQEISLLLYYKKKSVTYIYNFQIASEGNWMHIHYQSRLQAKKALSKNAKIFGGTIMVGVTPCIYKVS